MVRPVDQNPYVFIVGCPRSGTTLLQRMLDHHPRLAMANDTHFIPRAIKGVKQLSDLAVTSDLIERVRSYRRFRRLGLTEEVVSTAAESSRTYRGFVSLLYSEYGRLHGKALAGEKTPDYVRYLSLLHELFPWVKTVHIIRDGRDVALSTLEWAQTNKGPGRFELWSKEPVAVCALWWQRHVSTGRIDGNELGPERYHEVKYEDLIVKTEQELREIAAFLELPFAPQMLAYHEGKVRSEGGMSAKKAWLPPISGLRDWRTQMKERELELFEAIAGDLLSKLGYELACNAISPEVARVAAQCRNWWEAEMTRRRVKHNRHFSQQSDHSTPAPW